MSLPDTYKQVEYIQSSGTQYIDTLLNANQNTIVEAKWSLTQYNSAINYDKMYWSFWVNDDNVFFMQSNRPANNRFRITNYSNHDENRVYIDSSANLVIWQIYETKHTNTEFYVDWTLQWTCAATTYTSWYSVTIFGLNMWSNTVGQKAYMKLYYFRMYNGNTLVRNLVPVIRKSDKKPWLYDLVNNTFYTNQGTGEFTYKEYKESWKITHRYVGTKQVRPSYEWKPDASRTLLYLPLESNTNDYSGNNRTCTPTSVTFTTVGWVKSAHVWTTGWIAVTPTNFITQSTQYKTTSVLVYVTSLQTSARRVVREWAIQNVEHHWLIITENTNWNINIFSWKTSWMGISSVIAPNTWILITETLWNWVHKVYVNWTLINTVTYTSTLPAWWNRPYSYQQNQAILCWRDWVNYWQSLNWNAREIIFENILWSDEDVSKYYQRIKAKLWF